MEFEHTDGLNYANIELRRHVNIFIKNNFSINLLFGGGFGIIVPRTNVTLFNQNRYDKFYLSRFGFGFVFGINFKFF